MSISLLFTLSAAAETELKGSPQELTSFLHPSVNTISISQSAEETASKDEAVIHLLVTTEDKKLADSLNKNAKIRNDISALLTADKVPLKNIKNSKFSTSPDYGWFGDKPDNYKVANTVTVRINNEAGMQSIAKAVDLYDEVTLVSTRYEHSEKDKYQQRVKEKALSKVLKQKDYYSEQLGLKLKAVSFTDETALESNDMEMITVHGAKAKRVDYSFAQSQAPVSFETVTYRSNVTVRFAVE